MRRVLLTAAGCGLLLICSVAAAVALFVMRLQQGGGLFYG